MQEVLGKTDKTVKAEQSAIDCSCDTKKNSNKIHFGVSLSCKEAVNQRWVDT